MVSRICAYDHGGAVTGRDDDAGGQLHRNDWLHDWLVANNITSESEAYNAAIDSNRLNDLLSRAEAQESELIDPPTGNSIIAGRSLDLTSYISCWHPDCVSRQVDELFGRVWHYFDNIAVVGPDAHRHLEFAESNPSREAMARSVAALCRPIFHIRAIGAEDLVTWVAKPPACIVHWEEYRNQDHYRLPEEIEFAIASALLEEGRITLEKGRRGDRLVLHHRQLFGGQRGGEMSYLLRRKKGDEFLELALARRIVEIHWVAAATDMYTAQRMNLPLGLGIRLEARLASLQQETISPAEIAFNLKLPVVDGLPVRELLSLRETEQDAFEEFRDRLTQAMKEKLGTPIPLSIIRVILQRKFRLTY